MALSPMRLLNWRKRQLGSKHMLNTRYRFRIKINFTKGLAHRSWPLVVFLMELAKIANSKSGIISFWSPLFTIQRTLLHGMDDFKLRFFIQFLPIDYKMDDFAKQVLVIPILNKKMSANNK